MDAGDIRYIWAAYSMGGLAEFDPAFDDGGTMNPQEFSDVFHGYIGANYNGGWIVESETKEGFRPAGFIVAWVRPKVIEIGAMIWFPWATPRGIFEGAVRFMDAARGEYTVFEFAHMKDKKFFERLARLGIMRRVGHIHGLYPDSPAVLFQTVRKK